MINKLFSHTDIMSKALDASWTRNEAIAQNIANVNTPGYKRKTVSFEDQLQEALDNSSFKGFRTDEKHIPIGGTDAEDVEIKVSEDNSNTSMRLDGNNVDIEQEMADMAKNTIRYNTLVETVSSEFKRLSTAINGEGK